MFINSSKILFLLTLFFSTLLTISATSWFGAWMGLEINLLSFIPLMNETNNLMNTEASLKYFLTQALASTALLFSIIALSLNFNFQLIMPYTNFSFDTISMSALLLKSGMAPFHFWFPEVMEGISWINNLILMTWQKIAPFFLFSYFSFNMFIYIPIFCSAFIGAIGGLNQTSLKKIMAFSSINHMSWMLLSMTFNEFLWMTYFLFYSFLSLAIILMFYIFQLFHVNQLFSMFLFSKTLSFILFFNFLSLGGLPPFLGFFPKWLIMNFLIANNQYFLISFLIFMALITLFFYLRLCYINFMIFSFKLNWIQTKIYINKKMNFLFLSFAFLNFFGLLLTPNYLFIL